MHIYTLFHLTFEDYLEPKNYEASRLRLIANYLDPREKASFRQDALFGIYKHELTFLKSLRSKKAVPPFIKRVLWREFIRNLHGITSDNYIPELSSRKEGDLARIEALVSECEGLITGSDLTFKGNREYTGIIDQKALLRVFSSPFFHFDLKHLLLQYITPANKAEALQEWRLPSKLSRVPYSVKQQITVSRSLEDFVILANYLELPKEMKQFDPPKRTLPYYNSDLIEAIVLTRKKADYNSVMADLKYAFEDSPDFSPLISDKS